MKLDQFKGRMPGKRKFEQQFVVLGILFVFLTALILRLYYVNLAGLPFADPWRHMALIRNIRNGAGFTLFADQPYIWYNPVWYYLVSFIAEPENAKWISAVIGSISVPLFLIFLYRYCSKNLMSALVGGILIAAFGPLIVFTCQLGAESFAIFLFICALLVGTFSSKYFYGFLSGIFYGLSIIARLQLCLSFFLFFSVIQKQKSRLFFTIGISIPILLQWLRNYAVIQNYKYIFTWDGMATESSEYNFFSILAPQIHPTISKATHMIYEKILPLPQWLYENGRMRWEIILFFLISLLLVMAAKRLYLTLSVLVTVCYLLIFDKTLSAFFFRNWVGLFPLLFIGAAVFVSKPFFLNFRHKWVYSTMLTILLLACGYIDFRPNTMFPVELATPFPNQLKYDYYMVNSGFYHPASLIYKFPSKHFIGMPLSSNQFDEFFKEYPKYDRVLWRESFNIQKEIFSYIKNFKNYIPESRQANLYGRNYIVYKKTD